MARHNDTSAEGRSVHVLRAGEQVRHILSDILMRGDALETFDVEKRARTV